MSYANIFSGSKIASQYLPTEAIVTPTLDEVLTAGDDAGGLDITNLASLNIGTGDNKFITTAGATLQIINQDTGVVAISCNDGVQIVPSSTTGTGQINIANGSATVGGQTSYEIYTPGTTSGGLTTGNMAIYGYLNGASANAIFETDRQGANIELGSTATVGGCVVSVNGSTGAGRVYDTVYNKPPGAVLVEQVVNTSLTVGGGGDEVQVFQIPAYVNDKYYRVTINYSLRWTGGAPAPGATDAVYFFADPANIAGTVEDAISSSWVYLTDIQNAGSGTNTDRTYCGSFSAIFKVADQGGTAPPRIFMGSSATTGVSATPLDISLVGTDTINITPTRAVWEQLTF
jgi:hypothetical protein